MREGLFIKKNKDRWERIQHEQSTNADEVARDFTQLVDDLAYAKTFYPSSKVTPYINSLASRIYLGIYQNRKEKQNRLAHFFTHDVPFAVGRHHLIMLFSLSIFFLFFSIGFFSSIHDDTFVRQVLGDGYVDMTEENIRAGNPFNVYADSNPFTMWLRIMINNIMVSFSYFFKGILLGVPSVTSLAKESIRIGAFEHMFFAKGLGSAAIVTVLLHGMLELTAIIITCGAGVVLGTSFLLPGTGTRLDAFKRGAKDGVKIVVGLVPVFVVAALIEGYITRHYKMPLFMSLSFLFVCTAFVVWYFIILPIKLKKRAKESGLPLQNSTHV
ncbi:MAG TPA: stage II sporulation protein M [Flavisolibacter sp.]|nr:stage II sporulation protein M [Flavisolibacter sp.]